MKAIENVVITGGTGTFGQAMSSYLTMHHPEISVRVLSRSELPQVTLQEEMPQITYMLGDVRDLDRLRLAFRGADIVLHAAALKHIAVGEKNPAEMASVNVDGTQNVIRACIDCGVHTAVLLSTDKAVAPANLYGATKLVGERLFTQGNVYSKDTRFLVTRYGNVMGSRGSVLPLYRSLLAKGKPLPVTHIDMSRFWMSPEQAVALVWYAATLGNRGDLIVPHLPAFALLDLIRALVGCRDISQYVDIAGRKPGEKISEKLLTDDERQHILPVRITPDLRAYIVKEWNKGKVESYDSATWEYRYGLDDISQILRENKCRIAS